VRALPLLYTIVHARVLIGAVCARIADVYDRTKFPDAFNSMISINEAQTRSLAQHSKISLSEETLTVPTHSLTLSPYRCTRNTSA
jgi:hypothetical protein